MTAHLISYKLCKHLEKKLPKNAAPEERTMSDHMAPERQVHENKFTRTAEEPDFENEETPRKKQIGEEDSLKVLTKAVQFLNTSRKNNIKAA